MPYTSLEKYAVITERGGIPSQLLANTVGRVRSAISIAPLILTLKSQVSPSGQLYGSDPEREEKHRRTADIMAAVEPDALSTVKQRLGGMDAIDDVIWKRENEDTGELPWYKQLGGRTLHNPRTGPVGKLGGFASYPMNWLLGNLLRSPHYNPYTDVAHNYFDEPSVGEHELGHALDFNKITSKGGTGKVSDKWYGRLGRGTLRDLYGMAYSLPGVKLWHEAQANRRSNKALEAAAEKGEISKDELEQRQARRWETLAPAYGSYAGAAASPMLGPLGPLMGVAMGKGVGMARGRQMRADAKKRKSKSKGKGEDGDKEKASEKDGEKDAADSTHLAGPATTTNNSLDDAVNAIIKTSNAAIAQLEEMWGDAKAPVRHTGQTGDAPQKAGDASTATYPYETLAKIGTFAPSTNQSELNAYANQLAGFEHHDVPMVMPQQWQGPPQQAQGGTMGGVNQYPFGYPIDHGKLGNGAGVGGIGGGGGISAEKIAGLNVSAVGEGDYSKLRIVPHSSFGPKVLDEIEGRMNSQAKQSPCDKLQEMEMCEESDGKLREEKDASCSHDQNWLEKLAVGPPAWLSGMAGGLQDSFKGMDPTLKSGLVGAGVGGGMGALVGGLNRMGGGVRPAITPDMAMQLQNIGVSPAIIQKLLQPDREGDLVAEEIQQLEQLGVNYDEIAPQPGYLSNMAGGVAKGGLIGGALGGIGAAGAQEIPRWLAGKAAPGAGADAAGAWIPDWAPQGLKDIGGRIGRTAGNLGWNSTPRQEQFDITENALNIPSPSSWIDSTLDRLNPKGA